MVVWPVDDILGSFGARVTYTRIGLQYVYSNCNLALNYCLLVLTLVFY